VGKKKDNILAAFGLGATDLLPPVSGDGSSSVVSAAPESGVGPVQPPSAHALEVDKWGQRRGRELLAGEYKPKFDPLNLGDGDSTREAAAADLFASLFENKPRLRDTCADPTRHQFMEKLFESDPYRAMHAVTQLDDDLSAIAAVKLAEELSALREKRATPRPPKPGEPKKTDDERKLEDEIEAMESVDRAVAEASAEVEAAKDAAAACGLGGGGGDSGIKIPPKAISALYKRIATDPRLRRICELAGRFRRLAQGKQRNKLGHGYDDMVGVEPGGDVGRLVSSELAALAVPGLDTDVLLKLVESRATCREHKGMEPVGKGPIVVTVDESGSMDGEPVFTAKALALALAWIARVQKRWCCLVGFSGGTEGTFCVLPPGRWDESALCDWLTHFYGNGTTLDVPVAEVPANWNRLVASGMQRGKCDMIMITDAQLHLPKAMEEGFLAFKKREQVNLTAMVLRSKAGDLARIADTVYHVSKIGVGEEAVEAVVSI
jgi:uncharacterized protein with von Willebrand factor type A (vWA) domain